MTPLLEEKPWYQRLMTACPAAESPGVHRDIQDIFKKIGDDQLSFQLFEWIAHNIDRQMQLSLALTTLDRLLATLENPLLTVTKWLGQTTHFHKIWKMFGASPFLSQILIQQYDDIYILMMDHSLPGRDGLVQRAVGLTTQLHSEKEVSAALRKFRLRWSWMIASLDLSSTQSFPSIISAISHLADACLEAALKWSLDHNIRKFGQPVDDEGKPCQIVALALGKLGGVELNYSSDVDLIFIYSEEGRTRPATRSLSARDFYARVVTDFLKIMSGGSSSSFVLRVDLRLRPEGSQGPLLMSLDQTLSYYDNVGRTWERQALIKVRPCAGHLPLGDQFRKAIEPFVYRRFLTSIEISEIQALKRRMEHRSVKAGAAASDVKTGHGGIRDIEFVVQFLQLLNGCTMTDVRHAHTLESLTRLKNVGCLTPEEFSALEKNYLLLRTIEHRLQLTDDRQTHQIPESPEMRRRLALQMGYLPMNAWESAAGPWERLHRDYQNATRENHLILNRILHETYQSVETEGADPVTDMILDPGMPEDVRAQTLARFGIVDTAQAYASLTRMAREEKSFFSTARCRHFFSALAPKMMKAVEMCPSPDHVLQQLDTISQNIPGKAAFWESLNAQPPALRSFLDVALHLKLPRELLIKRPEFFETWLRAVLEKPPISEKMLDTAIVQLMQSSPDLSADLARLRDEYWLQISSENALPLAVPNILEMTRQISLLAKCMIRQQAARLWSEGLVRWKQTSGHPSWPGHWAILAVGKMGSEDLLFHSDLDLLFLHQVSPSLPSQRLRQFAEAFFQDLAARFIRSFSGSGSHLIYRIDTRLRPYGNSGPLSVSMDQLQKYYQSGEARVWERAALIRNRPIYFQGMDEMELKSTIQRYAYLHKLENSHVWQQVRELRVRTIASSPDAMQDLKRADGGVHEAELLIQSLQLMNLHFMVSPPEANFWLAVNQLKLLKILTDAEADTLEQAYSLFRQVETAVRLLRNRATNPLVIQPEEYPLIERMIVMQKPDPAIGLQQTIECHQRQVHALFEKKMAENGG